MDVNESTVFEQEKEVDTGIKPHCIFYNDGSYVVYDLTYEDYRNIKVGMIRSQVIVEISLGLMKLTDIRSVIIQRPVVENKAINPLMTEEDIVWLKQWQSMTQFAEAAGGEESGGHY